MNELNLRLAKLRELADRGATEGEKAAARKGMERIFKRHNLYAIFDEGLKLHYTFKYATELELWLLLRITDVIVEVDNKEIWKRDNNMYQGGYKKVREVVMNLHHLDYITIECAYEYFRGHMKKQWNKTCLPVINRCRKESTKRKKRDELKYEFFQRYIIASNLYNQEELTSREIKSKKEKAAARLLYGIEGGKYNTQVSNGLYLEEKTNK